MHVVFRFWPGFDKLWNRGDFHSLLVSILFAWAFMLAWSATFVWPEWLWSTFNNAWIAWSLLVAVWMTLVFSAVGSALQSLRPSNNDGPSPAEAVKHLELAQEYYLQADYFEAERQIKKNVRRSKSEGALPASQAPDTPCTRLTKPLRSTHVKRHIRPKKKAELESYHRQYGYLAEFPHKIFTLTNWGGKLGGASHNKTK